MGELRAGTAPGAFPLVGHVGRLLRQPRRFLASLPDHGDLVTIRLGAREAHVVCHPRLLRTVLGDDRTFDKDGPVFDRARREWGDNITLAHRQRHRELRAMVQPGFHPDRLEAYGTVMEEEITAMTGGWRSGQIIDVFPTLHDCTLRTLTRVLFSEHADGTAAAQGRSAYRNIKDAFNRRSWFSAVDARLPTPGNRRCHRAAEDAVTTLRRTIADYECAAAGPSGGGDMLSALLPARTGEDDATGGSDGALAPQLGALLSAGSETSAATLTWALYLLSRHPTGARRIREEADTVLGGQPARWHHLSRLPFTDRFITETLRLFPPVWLQLRYAVCEVDIADRRLEPGDMVVVSPISVHHRADIYPAPWEFDPDRWLPERARTIPHGSFAAFSHGPRKCLGDAFAMAQTTLLLATIAARWRVESAPGSNLRCNPLDTAVHPKRVLLRLHQINSSMMI
jgi:pentalenene oxygenase